MESGRVSERERGVREKVRKRMREGEGGQGNRYVIISSNLRTFQVSGMKKLQDFHVFLVSRMLYLTLASLAFNSWVGNYWARCVFTRLLLFATLLFTLRLDMAAISKDSSHNEQPILLSNGPLLAEQRPTKGLPFL